MKRERSGGGSKMNIAYLLMCVSWEGRVPDRKAHLYGFCARLAVPRVDIGKMVFREKHILRSFRVTCGNWHWSGRLVAPCWSLGRLYVCMLLLLLSWVQAWPLFCVIFVSIGDLTKGSDAWWDGRVWYNYMGMCNVIDVIYNMIQFFRVSRPNHTLHTAIVPMIKTLDEQNLKWIVRASDTFDVPILQPHVNDCSV